MNDFARLFLELLEGHVFIGVGLLSPQSREFLLSTEAGELVRRLSDLRGRIGDGISLAPERVVILDKLKDTVPTLLNGLM